MFCQVTIVTGIYNLKMGIFHQHNCKSMLIRVTPSVNSAEVEGMNEKNLEWGWKPILIALRLIGYDLRDPSVSPRNRWLTFYCFLCLVYSAFWHTFDCFNMTTFFIRVWNSNPPSNMSSVLITSIVVDVYNNTFHSVGIQLAVFFMARSSWKGMWQAFQDVGKRLDCKFPENLRIVSSSAVIVIVLIVIVVQL